MSNKTQPKLTIGHQNIRSLLPSFVDFKNFVDYNYDIIGVTETWLNNSIKSDVISISGYNFFRKDRVGRHGGGIGCYARSFLNCEVVNLNLNDDSIEYLCVRMKLKSFRVMIVIIYRPPQSNILKFLEFVENMLGILSVESDYSVIIGDLNIDMLKPNLLQECFDTHGYVQLINVPTRITQSSATLLDPIFISDKDICHQSGTVTSDLSDHNQLSHCTINISIQRPKLKFITYRNFKHFSESEFMRDLSIYPWDNIYYTNDINKKVALITEGINDIFDKHAPHNVIRVSKQPAPWLTDNLKLIYKLRDKALQKYRSRKTVENFQQYKEYRNFALASTRREKTAYLQTLINNKNEKLFWTGLRNLNIRTKTSENTLPNSLQNANEINDYFASVFKKSDNCKEKINYYSNNKFGSSIFNFRLISAMDVISAINSIKSNSAGQDGITLFMLKLCVPVIANHITHIINCSLERGYFPRAWREALVKPFPKIPNPTEYKELRPINLLPIMSKVLERIVFLQIYEYICANNILPQNQSGFRRCHSTTTAMLNLTDNIFRSLDKNLSVILISLDYSKAFDMIDHELLCSKLKYYGLDEISQSFFKTYLWRRSQKVCLNNKYSNAMPVISGVPQGSILGPLLFLLYTSDLPNIVTQSDIQLYADDTQVLHYFDPKENPHVISQSINSELDRIAGYSKEHNLTLNESKTSSILLCSRNKRQNLEKNMTIKVNGTVVNFSNTSKNLGMVIDSNLRFREHLKIVLQKSYMRLKLLYANKHILNYKMRKKLCETWIFSVFNYCNLIYYPCLDKIAQKRLQIVQNTCCRFVCNLRKFDHVSFKINQLGWLTLENMFKYHLLLFLYRLEKTKTPLYLYEKLVLRSSIHDRQIRNNNMLTMPRHSSAIFERSFSYNAVKYHNLHKPDISLSTKKYRKFIKNKLFDIQIEHHQQ